MTATMRVRWLYYGLGSQESARHPSAIACGDRQAMVLQQCFLDDAGNEHWKDIVMVQA